MKRILFPTDFSEVATNAFIHALEYANLVEGELLVLHSYDLPPIDSQFFPENFTELYDTVELAHFDLFKEELPKLRKIIEERNLDHVKMTHRLMEGNLAANIKKSVQEDNIDFLVMGTSGQTDWEGLFAGTNSGSVILELSVPMLCVPIWVKYKKINTIGYITHYRAKDQTVLTAVLEFAKQIDAKVKCLYVKNTNSGIDTKSVNEWQDLFSQEPVKFFMIESDEIKQETLDFIQEQQIDILSMLTYKSSFFEGMFVPNYSKKSDPEIQIPLLIFHS